MPTILTLEEINAQIVVILIFMHYHLCLLHCRRNISLLMNNDSWKP